MANPIRVVTVPRDASVPSAGIAAADWTQAQANIYDLTADNILARGREFDVKAYGAVGDGVTDDTATIQAAVNAMQGTGGTGGGTLVFPFGRYIVSSPITIAKHGIRVDSSGGFTAILEPSASFPAGDPVLDFSIPNSVFRGPQVKNLRIYLHGSNASGVRFRSAYDNAMMENVFIDGMTGPTYGVKFDIQPGASSTVGQTFTAINCWVNGRSGFTGIAWDITDLQEASFMSCKGLCHSTAAGTAWSLSGCRSVALYNCSASAAAIGFHVTNSTRPLRHILIDSPLFEDVAQSIKIEGSSGDNVGAVTMRFPRVQTLAGGGTVNYADGCVLDMGSIPLTISAGAAFTQVKTGNRANITDSGAYTQIEETRNATNGRPGMSPGLNLFASSSPELRFEVVGRTGHHRLHWSASGGADNGFYHTMHNGTTSWNMHTIVSSGISQSWHVWNGSAAVETLKIERLPAVGKTGVYIATNRAGTVTLQQVEVGAVDSGGTGYRVLRIPN